MQTTRTHNFSLFITVLSACLLAAGTPAQLYAQPAPVGELFAAATETKEEVNEIKQKTKRTLYPSVLLRPVTAFVFDRACGEQSFAENTKSLAGNNSILLVTRLPRAALAA
ncbi:MAG: hypothetical protein JOZ52_01865 [Acidobacteria bacterium]|nr:hypothetical protein [Acidobacteriota bacterium]